MLPAYGNILSLCHHHWMVTYDSWRPLVTFQEDFYRHSDVQMYLPPPFVQSPLCALLPCSCCNIEPIRQLLAAVMVICQAPRHQISLGEYRNSIRFCHSVTISIIKAEHTVFRWKEDLKCHFLWVSDVEVAEDAEICRGQGCDPIALDHEACVVLYLQVRILGHHLQQPVTQQRKRLIIYKAKKEK